jgi:gluconokinase
VNYFLGIDIGTTHTKAVIITGEGKLFFEAKRGYELLRPKPGYEEQDPVLIMEAVADVMAQAFGAVPGKNKIIAVSFSAAMHSILPVDKEGKPLHNVIIWADTRSKHEAEEISKRPGATEVYANTGIPAHPMSPLCKIVWFKNQLPEIFAKAARFISIKEYVFSCLFGKYIVDFSIASASGLFNNRDNKWDPQALAIAGIDESRLSQPVSTLHAEYELTPFYAELLKIKEQIPFVTGSSDGCLANLGSGVVNHGEMALTIGTSGAVRMTVKFQGNRPESGADPEKLFTYPLAGDLFVRGGAINNGGIVLKWLAELFSEQGIENYEEMLSDAIPVPPGANGLLFLPYLLGERAPVWDADAKGVLFGLTMKHKREQVIRASVEGVCFTLYQIIRKLEAVYGNTGAICVSGGFVRSSFWVQLMADITGKKINVTELADASAIGAAYIGMYMKGHISDLSEVKKFTRISQVYEPDPQVHALYKKIFQIFDSLYPKLKDDFAALSRLQEN